MSLSTEEFLRYLEQSGLVEHDVLTHHLDELVNNLSSEKYQNSEVLAAALVQRGLITDWHARQLMRKKYKGFFLRQYRILRHLGSGGMSTVFLAEHTVMQRQVAIKVLPKKRLTHSVYLDRFIREAQAIASLDNANIVRAYDIDQVDEIHYIVMEYFDGDNLRQRVEKTGPLGFEDAVNYILQAARGLAHAHRIGIIHRDVKPENLLVNDEGTVKLLDLGLALLDESLVKGDFTEDQSKVLGTADYLAPEQAVNSATVDCRADIYSLGCTLYFCLTGHPPFPTGTIAQRVQGHKTEIPKSIFIDRPEAPDDLVNICSKMMEKNPNDRFQTAEDLIAVFQYWLIIHGYAEEKDFPAFSAEEEQNLSDRDTLMNFQVTGSKSIFDFDIETSSIHSTDPRNTSTINLFSGSNESSKLSWLLSSKSEASRILQDRPLDELEETTDPFELAMREISVSQAEQAQLKSSALRNVRENGTGNGLKSSVSRQALRESSFKEVNVQEKGDRSEESTNWSHKVPFWFWVLFGSGYVAAIFLTGILFALLAKLGKGN